MACGSAASSASSWACTPEWDWVIAWCVLCCELLGGNSLSTTRWPALFSGPPHLRQPESRPRNPTTPRDLPGPARLGDRVRSAPRWSSRLESLRRSMGHTPAGRARRGGAGPGGHRPGRYPEHGTDPVLAPPLFAAHHHDRFLDIDRSLGRTAVRPRRAVLQAATAFLPEASDPAVSALSRDALGLRSVSDCPALLADAFDEQLPTTHVQPGITVGHEDLRTVGDLASIHRTRRSSLASMTRRVFHQRPGRVQLAADHDLAAKSLSTEQFRVAPNRRRPR